MTQEFDFARKREKRGRITVSLDPSLVTWAKECAHRNDVSVSAVVELALRKARRINGEAPDHDGPPWTCPACADQVLAAEERDQSAPWNVGGSDHP